ncbi:trypsin-like peptidase domain-containing protein [Sphingomonas sp. CJ99]
MLIRLILAFALLIGLGAPARADDIAVSARGVVRIVTIAVIEDEVVDFSHGSGFAIAPNRVVINAHVVEAAARYPGDVVIGVVPSEGSRAVQGRLIALDPDRDLALIEFDGVRLSPLVLFTGPVAEGAAVVALGYPGNVDLATARSARDFITPLTPVRSQGVLSGQRSLIGTNVLLHTASIARGNSGGPLLDRCGRVLGVNSALTRGEEGDSSFGIAVTEAELAAFLRQAKQPVRTIGSACIEPELALEQQREADEVAGARAADAARAEAARVATQQALAADRDRMERQVERENFIAASAMALALSVLALCGAGLLFINGRRRGAIGAAAAGIALLIGAVLAFVLRPGIAPSVAAAGTPPAMAAPAVRQPPTGPMVCTPLPDRSRITISAMADVELDWRADGCANGKSAFLASGNAWERIALDDNRVSVLRFDPATATLTDNRYYLSAARIADLRADGQLTATSCPADAAARTALAQARATVRQSLPARPDEWLTYRCAPASPAPAG